MFRTIKALPSNIDLTEHHDFGSWPSFDVIGDFISQTFTYEEVEITESPFIFVGNRVIMRQRCASRIVKSPSRFYLLFDIHVQEMRDESNTFLYGSYFCYGIDPDNGNDSFCIRCGNPLIPWDIHDGLCSHCYEEIYHKRIPWKEDEKVERLHGDAYDDFNLR